LGRGRLERDFRFSSTGGFALELMLQQFDSAGLCPLGLGVMLGTLGRG
jgi:hypothetical protein